MSQQQGSKRVSSGVIAAISAAVVLVGGGVGWLTWNSSQDTNPTPSERLVPGNPPQVGNEQTTQIYWLQNTGTNFKLVPQSVQVQANRNQPNQFLTAAFQRLLEGPTEGSSGSSTIPQGTKLLGVDVQGDTVRVNLSGEFTSGGGSTSMQGRIGQIVYTATSLNPNAKVYIDVDGKQLDVLGGEGLELEQPLTRQNFKENFQL
ncbi:GerMN domain-containing protein [Fischerella thermalis]|uniref:GerMN domain-containing protein n=1 Tax=Fischerella thermalis TaxID=372787 RepID=UPI000C80BD49|nr:GerMN domain-containing protein [Fischerella thermalis]MBF2070785.1 GerMN domain-containing protein [Fischerella thermalis M48_A2018_028]PLZ87436.1 spore germination protein [Fischerella thermalis CCMEE 5194]